MKKLRVHINPGVHPQFKEITDFPPKNVEYIFKEPKGDHNNSFTRKKRSWIAKLHRTGIPRMTYVKNAKQYDLLHSTRGILPLNKMPWVTDIESGAAFSGLDWVNLAKPKMQKRIRKFFLSSYCKKILPQSDAAKRSLLENLDCSGFEDKIETLYLAYRPSPLKRKPSKTVRLSFIGRGFYEKGGHHVQEAFKILNKKYDISLKVKCNIPSHEKLDLPNVTYVPRIEDPKEFYDVIFGDCDIYVQPTTIDSYGVTILEAMSTGLPIVCVDDFTLPEMVENGVNGFTIKSPLHWYDYRMGKYKQYGIDNKKLDPETISQLVEKLSILIEDKKLREKMGRESFNLVAKGKFSIKERNKKLRRIYDEALKK